MNAGILLDKNDNNVKITWLEVSDKKTGGIENAEKGAAMR